MNEPWSIDPDITRAHTLPARAYRSEEAFQKARERIFARSWQPIGEPAHLKAPGRVLPVTMLEGYLDEPLVLTRDQSGKAHCLSNVCTHRGALVVEGEGHAQSLRCRYHGRRFGLDGCMKWMPEFEEAKDFPSPADDLPSIALREWGPLYFASLDPAWPFEEWIAPVRERTDWMRPERFAFDAGRSTAYLVEANWALYCDNYLEGFHLPYVHGASLGGKLDYGTYRTELFDWCNVQVGPAAAGEPFFDLPEGHPDAGKRIGAWYFWLFPNTMLNFYPWGLSLNIAEPLSPSRTRLLFRSYVKDPSKLDEGAGAELHRIEMEDEEIVESAQRGVRSRLYDRGRYSPTREEGPHHFHGLLARFLAMCLALFCALAVDGAPAEAQRRGRPQQSGGAQWVPAVIGLYAGTENRSNSNMVGAQLRVPVLPSGLVTLGASADVSFLTDLREYQYNLDAVLYPLALMGARAGLFVGGGIGWRDSVYGDDLDGPRERKRNYAIVGGLSSRVVGAVGVHLEVRWLYLEDVSYSPRILTLGLGLPLWGGTRR